MNPNWDVIPQELSSLGLQLHYTAQNHGHSQSEESLRGNLWSMTGRFPWKLVSPYSISRGSFHVMSLLPPRLVLSSSEGPPRDGAGNNSSHVPSHGLLLISVESHRGAILYQSYSCPLFSSFFPPTSNLYVLI